MVLYPGGLISGIIYSLANRWAYVRGGGLKVGFYRALLFCACLASRSKPDDVVKRGLGLTLYDKILRMRRRVQLWPASLSRPQSPRFTASAGFKNEGLRETLHYVAVAKIWLYGLHCACSHKMEELLLKAVENLPILV